MLASRTNKIRIARLLKPVENLPDSIHRQTLGQRPTRAIRWQGRNLWPSRGLSGAAEGRDRSLLCNLTVARSSLLRLGRTREPKRLAQEPVDDLLDGES